MNLLEATQKYAAWSGVRPGTVKPAVSRILTDGENLNIGTVGVFTVKSQIALAIMIRRVIAHKRPRNLILNFASSAGEHGGLPHLLAAIERAKRQCNVFAKIDGACGPALYAALSCHLVFAEPTSAIGHVGYWFAGVDSAEVPGLAAVDYLAQFALIDLRPKVTPATWQRLMHSAVNGEQAEALGIVGGLHHGLLME